LPQPGQLIAINGFEMYYETRGEGEPLVLLHGGAGVGANWRLVFDEAPQGSQLIVPDLRGHGSSTNPSGEFTFRQSAQDVFALLDHLGIGPGRLELTPPRVDPTLPVWTVGCRLH
jgi:pimeloyl-ACP methyl ester carboxylesterase